MDKSATILITKMTQDNFQKKKNNRGETKSEEEKKRGDD